MKTAGKKGQKRALAAPPGVGSPAAAAEAADKLPAPPAPLTPAHRRQIQSVLTVAERTLPALRSSGEYGLLGLVAQLAHALKGCAEHSHALEAALGLVKVAAPPAPPAPPPAPPGTTTNGVHQ